MFLSFADQNLSSLNSVCYLALALLVVSGEVKWELAIIQYLNALGMNRIHSQNIASMCVCLFLK